MERMIKFIIWCIRRKRREIIDDTREVFDMPCILTEDSFYRDRGVPIVITPKN